MMRGGTTLGNSFAPYLPLAQANFSVPPPSTTDPDGHIVLTARQPSFRDLSGSPIPKGSKSIHDMLKLADVDTKTPTDYFQGRKEAQVDTNPLIVFACTDEHQEQEERDVYDDYVNDPDNDINRIALTQPQPSFQVIGSSALVPKGSKLRLQPPPMYTKPSQTDDVLTIRREARIARRWAEIGYQPQLQMRGYNTYQPVTESGDSNDFITFDSIYPRMLEVDTTKTLQRVNSSGMKLFLEMPHADEDSSCEGEEYDSDYYSVATSTFSRPVDPFFKLHRTNSASSLQKRKQYAIPRPAQMSPNSYTTPSDSSPHTPGTGTELSPNLLSLITHPRESLVFLAISGAPIFGYSKVARDEVLEAVNEYRHQCLAIGFNDEAQYLEGILKSITNDMLFEANSSDEDLASKYNKQLSKIDAEYMEAYSQLEQRFATEKEALDEEWQSEKAFEMHNRPSPQLVRLRELLWQGLTAKRFNEAQRLQDEVTRLEEMEAASNRTKMQQKYQLEVRRLDRQFRKERQTIDAAYNEKQKCLMSQLAIAEAKSQKKIAKLTKADHAQSIKGYSTVSPMDGDSLTVSACPGEKLRLPDIMPPRRTLVSSKATRSSVNLPKTTRSLGAGGSNNPPSSN